MSDERLAISDLLAVIRYGSHNANYRGGESQMGEGSQNLTGWPAKCRCFKAL